VLVLRHTVSSALGVTDAAVPYTAALCSSFTTFAAILLFACLKPGLFVCLFCLFICLSPVRLGSDAIAISLFMMMFVCFCLFCLFQRFTIIGE
jgi:hypothetical protein